MLVFCTRVYSAIANTANINPYSSSKNIIFILTVASFICFNHLLDLVCRKKIHDFGRVVILMRRRKMIKKDGVNQNVILNQADLHWKFSSGMMKVANCVLYIIANCKRSYYQVNLVKFMATSAAYGCAKLLLFMCCSNSFLMPLFFLIIY